MSPSVEEWKWRCRGGKERVQETQKRIIRYTINISGGICQAALCLTTAAGASNEPNPVFVAMPPESDLPPPQPEDRAWQCRGLAFTGWTDRLSVPA